MGLRKTTCALGFVLAGGGVVGVPAAAQAAPLTCGATLTTNVVLTTDLRCHGTALAVAAQGITVDLGGHTIAGDGTGAGIGGDSHFGPFRGMTIKNGTITGFDVGINVAFRDALPPSQAVNTADHLTLRGNRVGLNLYGSAGEFAVNASTFVGNTSLGISGADVHMTVTASTFVRNGAGVATRPNGSAAIADSTFVGNTTGVICGNVGVSVRRSRFVDNSQAVYSLMCGTTLEDTVIVGGKVAVEVIHDIYGLTVRRTTILGAGLGMKVWGGPLRETTIEHSSFVGNKSAGLYVDAVPMAIPPRVVLTSNVFSGNGYAPGTYVDPQGKPLTVGLWASVGTVTSNTAALNAGLGIDARSPAVDGGGNRALRNGDQRQCLGVVCTSPLPTSATTTGAAR